MATNNMEEMESVDTILCELPTLPADEPSKREACTRCKYVPLYLHSRLGYGIHSNIIIVNI